MALKRLDQSEIYNITLRYYSEFSCVNLSELRRGVHFVCTAERDRILKGYGCKFPLYILRKDDLCVVAYSPALRSFIELLKNRLPDDIIAACDAEYHLKKMQLFIFAHEKVERYGNAKILSAGDYPLFEDFFRKTHKSADPDGWLCDYYSEKAGKGYFAGYFKDGRLVSVCDAPDMPYMEDSIQHTGIVTLEEERRQGYGKITAALATHNLLQKGVCPQWECGIGNVASLRLALSIGYMEFAKAYILEE